MPAAEVSLAWNWQQLRDACDRETRRILGARACADDATQEALVRAWRQHAQCHTPDDPVGWVRAIARREALRIAARRQETSLEACAEEATAAPDDRHRATTSIDLMRALGGLKPAERSVVLLRYWEDLTQAEAARRLGIPSGTARVRLHRARSRLRAALPEYCEA